MKIKKQKGVIDMKNREKPPQFLSKNRGMPKGEASLAEPNRQVKRAVLICIILGILAVVVILAASLLMHRRLSAGGRTDVGQSAPSSTQTTSQTAQLPAVLCWENSGVDINETISRPEGYPENIQDELAFDLQKFPDTQKIRVIMSYYDQTVVDSVKVDGVTLSDLCKQYLSWYFEEQKLPQAVFESLYSRPEDPYSYFKENPRNSLLLKNYPKQVGTQQAFFTYAYDDKLQKKYPEAKRVVDYQKGYPETEPEQLFGHAKEMPYDSSRLDREIQDSYETIRSKNYPLVAELGQQINCSLIDTCVKKYGLQDVEKDSFQSRMTNRFTATLSKKQILELAERDENLTFWKLGAALRPEGCKKTISPDLAAKLQTMKENEKLTCNITYWDAEFFGYDDSNENSMIEDAKKLHSTIIKKYGENNSFFQTSGPLEPYYIQYLKDHVKGFDEEVDRYLRLVFPSVFTKFLAYKQELTQTEILAFSQQPNVAYMDCIRERRAHEHEIKPQ